MNVLVDRNLEGYAIRFVMFADVGLEINSSDRLVWQVAQNHQMILLTANRSMKGLDSLLRNHSDSKHPGIIACPHDCVERLAERDYRERCSLRLFDIILNIDNFRGVGRLFIP